MAASTTQASIRRPELVRQIGNMNTQRAPVTDAANSFSAQDLVTVTAGALVKIATAGVLLYGWVLDISHASTELPPQSFFGESHYVLDPHFAEFEINTGTVNGTNAGNVATFSAGSATENTGTGSGASAANPSLVTIGTAYGVLTPTAGTFTGVQFLDPANTATTLFTVVAKIDGVNDTDGNGRVRVRPIETKIQ